MVFQRLVRYEHNGEISYGNWLSSKDDDFTVQKLDGNLETGFQKTDVNVVVRTVGTFRFGLRPATHRFSCFVRWSAHR
jgi:hypothetical protein